MDKKRLMNIILLGIFSLVLIPLTGITLGLKGPYFLKSLSRISGDIHHFGHIILFGNLIVFFVIFSIYYLKDYHQLGNWLTFTFFFLSCLCFELTFLIPYIPNEYILLRDIHNVLAYLSIIMLVLSLALLILTLPNFSQNVFQIITISFALVVAICLFILETTNIPSAFFEVTLVTLATNLIFFTIILLYINEQKKLKGTLPIKYKIIRNKKFRFAASEIDWRENDEKRMQTLLQEQNSASRSNFLKLENVYLYYDRKNNKTYLSISKSPASAKTKTFALKAKFWAVFLFDDLMEKTQADTRRGVFSEFQNNAKYRLDEDIYLEKYFVRNKKDIIRGEIWIPAMKK